MKGHWNDRYINNEAAYGKTPNVYFAKTLRALGKTSDLTKMNILLPCDGEGRNAIYAAQLGLKVRSFDASEVGVKKSLQWAKEAGVTIHSTCEDAFEFYPKENYDVIGLIFAHMPTDLREEFHKKIESWLAPGGTLILEGFHKEQLGRQSGGPKKKEMLFDTQMMKDDFSKLEFIQVEKVVTEISEGEFHNGEAVTLQMRAKSIT
jgi:2-polyprenyl-3-methyl-5-hydroxy-6-metoxy-1,4-benzoquinol methylase